MAPFGGHVVRHVLCRRDKVRDVFVAFGLNAKQQLQTTCLAMAACFNVMFKHSSGKNTRILARRLFVNVHTRYYCRIEMTLHLLFRCL